MRTVLIMPELPFTTTAALYLQKTKSGFPSKAVYIEVYGDAIHAIPCLGPLRFAHRALAFERTCIMRTRNGNFQMTVS